MSTHHALRSPSRRASARRSSTFRVALFIACAAALAIVGGAPTASAHHTTGPAAPAATAEGPEIVFPVVGPVTYSDTWGACRGAGCSRRHKGVDVFGHKLAPLVAATDGTITFIRRSALSISGNTIIVESDDGWRYLYIHLNNDGPGTDDGTNPQAWIVPNRLRVGDRVEAGQVIGYLGDSGNAETTPAHVHFEIHRPGTGAINPTPFVQAADDAGRRVTVASLASTSEGRAEAAPSVIAWYEALLDREPTDVELFAWTDRFDIGFATTDDLIADLTMAKPRRDLAGVVVRAFQVSLDRRPSLRELRAWEDAVSNGTSLEAISATLIASEAFTARHGDLGDEAFVQVIYDNAIGQPPSDKRLADWLGAFADGEPRATLPAYFADSYAVKDSTWHGLEVIQAYRAGLDRLPDDDEFERWVAHLDDGGLIPDVVEVIRADR
ncbi:MAG: peptidoglycan DD-metalloendopeptidase family protein [Actinomycetota bacterium]